MKGGIVTVRYETNVLVDYKIVVLAEYGRWDAFFREGGRLCLCPSILFCQ
jgi:hypothetical protein